MVLALEIAVGLALLLLCGLIIDVVREELPRWFHSRPWDPPVEGPSQPAKDMTAIYRVILKANGCKNTKLDVSEYSVEPKPYKDALGEMYSEQSSHSISPVVFLDDGNTAQVYFARWRGPLNGIAGTYAVSRRKSGTWGVDGPVGWFVVS